MYDLLVETHFDPNDPAKIIGKKPLLFGNFDELLRQEIATQSTDPQAYRGSLHVDSDRWLVITDDQLYTSSADGVLPAKLYVKIAYSVRDPQTWEPWRYVLDRPLDSPADTMPRVVRREEIFVKVIGEFDTSTYQYQGSTDNLQSDDVVAKANYYLDAAQSEYIELDSIDTEYAGLVNIQVNGLIQQVTHTIHAGPNGYAKTRASLAMEHNPYVLPWPARRRVEKAWLNDQERAQKDSPVMRNAGPFRSGGF
jgi:hypothetical protein